MRDLHRTCCRLAAGGLLLGAITAFSLVDYSQLLTSFLAALFSAIVSIFLGGAAQNAGF